MGATFDSLGFDLVFAGVVIILAGMFLTPMRSVIFNRIRFRRPRAASEPLAASEAPAEPTRAGATPAGVAAVTAHDDYREQEALFARTLLTAQKTAEDLVRNAQAEAQTIIRIAEAEAEDIVRAGRRNASEILQRSQHEADAVVESTKHKAAAWLAALQAEADRLAVDAHRAFQGAQRSVEQSVDSLAARFEHRMAEWEAGAWKQRTAPGVDGGTESTPGHAPSSSNGGEPPTVAGQAARIA